MKFRIMSVLIVAIFLLVACDEQMLDDLLSEVENVVEVDAESELEKNEKIQQAELLAACGDGEEYSPEEDVCKWMIECDDAQSCIEWGDQVILHLEEEYGSLVEEEGGIVETKNKIVAEYEVNLEDEEIWTEADISQETVDYHGDLWFSYAWIIPEYAREDMTKFEVFEDGSTLAHVFSHDDYAEEWTLGMNHENIELASETMVTYIHEFAHLLSLRKTEVDYFSEECPTIEIDETCFFEDAYLVDFYNMFYEDGAAEDNEENYVSGYAATSIFEDFAESFAHFVLTVAPEGDTLADEKRAFFYQYENLIELRADILSRCATWMPFVIEA